MAKGTSLGGPLCQQVPMKQVPEEAFVCETRNEKALMLRHGAAARLKET